MNTWTPVWSKLPDSSIWLESKEVKILFMTMLAIKDRDHVVRYSAFELARKANLSEAEVLEALEVLKNPDTKRLEPQEFDGRRIEKVEDGWLLLNGEKYRRKMQEVYRKEYKRVKQAEYRAEPVQPAEKITKPKASKIFVSVSVPDSLGSSPEFVVWWDKWLQNLKTRKKPPTELAQQLQLDKLVEMGPALAVSTIKNSIEKGYQGLFEPAQSKPNYGPPITTEADVEARIIREMKRETERALNFDPTKP